MSMGAVHNLHKGCGYVLSVNLQDFAEVTFPHLAPVCASARGDALLLLTRHADVFAARLPREPTTRVLLPLLARAADQGPPCLSCKPKGCAPCPFEWETVGKANALHLLWVHESAGHPLCGYLFRLHECLGRNQTICIAKITEQRRLNALFDASMSQMGLEGPVRSSLHIICDLPQRNKPRFRKC